MKYQSMNVNTRHMCALLLTNQLTPDMRIAIFCPNTNIIGFATKDTVGLIDGLFEKNDKKVFRIYIPINEQSTGG